MSRGESHEKDKFGHAWNGESNKLFLETRPWTIKRNKWGGRAQGDKTFRHDKGFTEERTAVKLNGTRCNVTDER